MSNEFLESALTWAKYGTPVMPCKPRSKEPLIAGGFHQASTNPEQIMLWWKQHPEANVAVVPGDGGFVVLDVDGAKGMETAIELNLPETPWITRSPGKGGGFHYWFRKPEGRVISNSSPWKSRGIDIRSDNGYVLVPPSVHPETGTPYTYACREDGVALPVLPDAALPSAVTGEQRSLDEIKGILKRVKYRPSTQSDTVLQMLIDQIKETPEGQRHYQMLDDTNTIATLVFEGKLTNEQALLYGQAYQIACEPYEVSQDFSSAMLGAYRKVPVGSTGKLQLKSAAETKMVPPKWLWEMKLPLNEFNLLAGREGIGKSTVAFDLAAQISKGKLPGALYGQPKSVIIISTEDSWESKTAPSLAYSGADLSRVYHVESTVDDWVDDIVLPEDLAELARLAEDVDAGLIIFDPLTSRLESGIDTHKDADVRRALEPLIGFAHKAPATILGLMHVNKGDSKDPLTSIMGSRAFSAAPRAVLFASRFDDDEFALSVVKSNYGPANQGSMLYGLDGGEYKGISAVKVEWGQVTTDTMHEIVARQKAGGDGRKSEMREWLKGFMSQERTRQEVISAAKVAGFEVTDQAISAALKAIAQKDPVTELWRLDG